jgi:hypothetical protein
LLAGAAHPAAATLGEAYSNAAPGAERGIRVPTSTSHARLLPSGVRVVEYVDRRGLVFAVTWSGPFLPDLRALLGRHFSAYTLQQQRQPSLHAPVVVRTSDVVIVSAGRMGAFQGHAWLPQRVPDGFDTGGL